MKARDIKKKLDANYNRATLEYHKTIRYTRKRIEIEQSHIRFLEDLLHDLFNVERKFDFNDID